MVHFSQSLIVLILVNGKNLLDFLFHFARGHDIAFPFRQAAQFLEALRNVDSSLLAQLIHGLKSRQDLAFIVIRIKGPQDHIAELERTGR